MSLQNFAIYSVRILVIFINNLYCIPTYLIWILLLQPLKYLYPKLYWTIEGTLYRWLLVMVGYWPWMCGHRIVEYGDDITECLDEETLVIVNHQSTSDVPMLMYAFLNKGKVINNIMWIMDKLFKYTNFGWVAQCHGDFFILQGQGGGRGNQLNRLSDHILNTYWPRERKWIILFPEGGFLYKRKVKSQKYAKANNLPVLEHVALPRVGCMNTILNHLSPKLETHNGPDNQKKTVSSKYPPMKYVIDLTVGYPDAQALSFLSLAVGTDEPRDISLYWRIYPAEDLPLDTEGLTQWTYDRFAEKEAILDTFYKTGSFPKLPPSHEKSKLLKIPKRLELNEKWIFSLHLFFIFSTSLHLAMFQCIYSSIF